MQLSQPRHARGGRDRDGADAVRGGADRGDALPRCEPWVQHLNLVNQRSDLFVLALQPDSARRGADHSSGAEDQCGDEHELPTRTHRVPLAIPSGSQRVLQKLSAWLTKRSLHARRTQNETERFARPGRCSDTFLHNAAGSSGTRQALSARRLSVRGEVRRRRVLRTGATCVS